MNLIPTTDNSFGRGRGRARGGRTNFDTRIYYPDRQVDESKISQLFGIVSSGDIYDIKKELHRSNIGLSVVNSSNESILNYIIVNDKLGSREKTTLAKYAIDNGAPINLFTKDNITPLHLAVKSNLDDLVKYMLDKGADANFQDNQLMTPLHYAIMPDLFQCVSEKKTDLIELPKIPKDVEFSLKKVYESLYKKIYEIYSGKNTNKYIELLKKIFTDLNYLYPDMISDYRKEYLIKKQKYNTEEEINKLNAEEMTGMPLLTKLNNKLGKWNNNVYIDVKRNEDGFIELIRNFSITEDDIFYEQKSPSPLRFDGNRVIDGTSDIGDIYELIKLTDKKLYVDGNTYDKLDTLINDLQKELTESINRDKKAYDELLLNNLKQEDKFIYFTDPKTNTKTPIPDNTNDLEIVNFWLGYDQYVDKVKNIFSEYDKIIDGVSIDYVYTSINLNYTGVDPNILNKADEAFKSSFGEYVDGDKFYLFLKKPFSINISDEVDKILSDDTKMTIWNINFLSQYHDNVMDVEYDDEIYVNNSSLLMKLFYVNLMKAHFNKFIQSNINEFTELNGVITKKLKPNIPDLDERIANLNTMFVTNSNVIINDQLNDFTARVKEYLGEFGKITSELYNIFDKIITNYNHLPHVIAYDGVVAFITNVINISKYYQNISASPYIVMGQIHTIRHDITTYNPYYVQALTDIKNNINDINNLINYINPGPPILTPQIAQFVAGDIQKYINDVTTAINKHMPSITQAHNNINNTNYSYNYIYNVINTDLKRFIQLEETKKKDILDDIKSKLDEFNKFYKKLLDAFGKSCDDYVKKIKDMYFNMNKIIDTRNKISYYNYINSILSDYNDDKIKYEDDTTINELKNLRVPQDIDLSKITENNFRDTLYNYLKPYLIYISSSYENKIISSSTSIPVPTSNGNQGIFFPNTLNLVKFIGPDNINKLRSEYNIINGVIDKGEFGKMLNVNNYLKENTNNMRIMKYKIDDFIKSLRYSIAYYVNNIILSDAENILETLKSNIDKVSQSMTKTNHVIEYYNTITDISNVVFNDIFFNIINQSVLESTKKIQNMAYNIETDYNPLVTTNIPNRISEMYEIFYIKNAHEDITNDTLELFDPTENVNDKKHKQIVDNYLYNTCYTLNENMINLLIEYTNSNSPDVYGKNIIDYAVALGNIDIITKLKNKGAKLTDVDQFNNNLEIMTIKLKKSLNANNFNDKNEEMTDKLINATEYKMILSFSELILPWTIYLINEYIYNKYSPTPVAGIIDLIKKQPGNEFLENIKSKFGGYYITQQLNAIIMNKLEKLHKKYGDKMNYLLDKIDKITKDDSLSSEKKQEMITKVFNKKTDYENRAQNITNQINVLKLKEGTNDPIINKMVTNIANETKFVSIYGVNVTKTYSGFSYRIDRETSNQMRIYTQIMDEYIKQHDDNIIYPIISNIDVKSYFTDPKLFNNIDNTILYNVLKIISHVISRTICLNFYNVVTKILILYVDTRYPNDDFENKRRKIGDTLKPLKEYIFTEKFSRDLVKITLKIYKDDTESDKMSTITISSLLDLAINKIYDNNKIQISKEDSKSTSKNDSKSIFNDNIIKIRNYFIEYIKIYINGCKDYVDNYLYSIIEYNNNMSIKAIINN